MSIDLTKEDYKIRLQIVSLLSVFSSPLYTPLYGDVLWR